ncbi:hypothetical protein FJTKL_09230 [Diaporthe vaccinii]|uniref:Uncharacterized protein n=1 Tax=Diaporthe vaccinii TaxID=105482 RepID=A0ABR4ENY6_9PEZI
MRQSEQSVFVGVRIEARASTSCCFLQNAVPSVNDASPNSHLRQTCFDSVRTLQESCLSSQSEASQLFITSRLRLRLPKPYCFSITSLSPPPLRTEPLPLHLHLRYPRSSSHQIQTTDDSPFDFRDNCHHTVPPD